MIHTRRAKQLVAILGAVAAVVAVTLAMLSSGGIVESATSGADPADALTVAPPVPEEFGALVDWTPDQPTIREVEPLTRIDLEAALVRAWHRIDVAQRTGDTAGVDTWFFGAIGDKVAASADGVERASVTQLGHLATVTFYSLDGTVIALDATSSLRRETSNGLRVVADERYEIVLRLSDGNWRIQHLVRMSDDR